MATGKRSRRIVREDGPHPVDVQVGERVRVRRNLMGLSQTELGDRIGVSFQQMQKYEIGAIRISASRLWAIAEVLDTPIIWFFDDIDPGGREMGTDPVTKRETLQLVRHFSACSPAVRAQLMDLFETIAKKT